MSKRRVSTEAFAERHLVRPQTIRKHVCLHGHYFGTKPEKLPNGRLAWPDEDEKTTEKAG
jgi:hypothetical protein